MNLLSVHNISFTWGYKSLVNKLSFTLNQGQTLGLAGPNGAGKTTLISLIIGALAPDTGDITLAPKSRLALVSQVPDFGKAKTIGDYLLSGIRPLAARLALLEEALEQTRDEQKLARLLVEFGEVQEAFDAAGGYDAENNASHVLERTGLALSLEQDLASLSGGEKSILSIVQALVANPELLILDEPGNHLDYLGLAWLETFLKELDTAIILISHNRYLLDHCVTKLLYLEAGRHWLHTGSYTSFREQREAELAEERKAWLAREKELHELNIELKNYLAQAAQSYNPPPRVMIQLAETKKKIARLRAIHDKGLTPLAKGIQIKLQGEELKGELALVVNDVHVQYGSRKVLSGVSFTLKRGDRTALLGLNGSGKTTLLRLIREEAHWDNPRLRLAPSMKLGYLTQQHPFLDMQRKLVDEVRDWGPLSIDAAFALLSPYAFAWNDLDKALSSFSGGELQRLQLAQLSYRKVNFLILDEPSNHLDIPSREALEACLASFPGTMLIVSHDRYFVDSFATKILHLEDGKTTEHEGNFSQFMLKQLPALRIRSKSHDGSIRSRSSVQENKSKLAPKPAPSLAVVSATTPLERRITILEEEINRIEHQILDALDKNQSLAERLQQKLSQKKLDLDKLFVQWEKT